MAVRGPPLDFHLSFRDVAADIRFSLPVSSVGGGKKVFESIKESCIVTAIDSLSNLSQVKSLQSCHVYDSWKDRGDSKEIMLRSGQSFQSFQNGRRFWYILENGRADANSLCRRIVASRFFSPVFEFPASLLPNYNWTYQLGRHQVVDLGPKGSTLFDGNKGAFSGCCRSCQLVSISPNSVAGYNNGFNENNREVERSPSAEFYRRYSRRKQDNVTAVNEISVKDDTGKVLGRAKKDSRIIDSASSKIFDSLNEEQRKAVEVPPGTVRIVAGPGSGKTRVLTHRVAHLILNLGVKPSQIMCITFTNRAKKEVEDRLAVLLGERGYWGMSVGTFHKTAVGILRESIGSLPGCGRTSDFVIFDDQDCIKLVKNSVEEVTKKKDFKEAGKILDLITQCRELKFSNYLAVKRNKLSVDGWRDILVSFQMLIGGADPEKVVRHYLKQLEENNAVDFLDLLILTVQLFYEAPCTLEYYQNKYWHVLVDEFQDTDEVQYEMVRLLTEKSKNLFVVGDVDQAIYSWRGANPRLMQMALDRDFRHVTTLQLRVNYRSNPNILKLATRVIEKSETGRAFGEKIPLALLPIKREGPTVAYSYLKTCRQEASSIVQEISRLQREGLPWDSFAILYRTHSQSRLFEEELMKRHIPFALIGGTPFYARKEIKDLIGYLRLIHNPMDEVSLSRIINVPPRAIGTKTWDNLKEWSKQIERPITAALLEFGSDLPKKETLKITPRARTSLAEFCSLMAELRSDSSLCTVGELLRKVLERLSYKDYIKSLDEKGDNDAQKRWTNVMELQGIANFMSGSLGSGRDALASFLEDTALFSSPEVETKGEKGEKTEVAGVMLMTIHSSKGLEFHTVFVPGLEEGILPSTKDKHEDIERVAEERRLLYVAVTRAEERLYLSHCESRFLYGRGMNFEVSRFMKNILPRYSQLVSGGSLIQPASSWRRLSSD